MSDLLQTIKEQIAKEWFEKKMPHVPRENQKFDLLIPYTQLDLWPEVCKRYAAAEYNQAIDDALNEFSEEITPAERYQKIQKLKKL